MNPYQLLLGLLHRVGVYELQLVCRGAGYCLQTQARRFLICLPWKVPSTFPVCRLLILAVMSSEPVITTVESALMSKDVKPTGQFLNQTEEYWTQRDAQTEIHLASGCPLPPDHHLYANTAWHAANIRLLKTRQAPTNEDLQTMIP